MGPLVFITDDPERSAALARELGTACEIHSLHAEPASIEIDTPLLVDVTDLSPAVAGRLHGIMRQARRSAPLVRRSPVPTT